MAAEQGAGGEAEDRAGGTRSAGVDRAADQGAAGGADDQTGGAVGALAAQAALRIGPGAALIKPSCAIAAVGKAGMVRVTAERAMRTLRILLSLNCETVMRPGIPRFESDAGPCAFPTI